jgi:hypothetical protein
LYLSLRVTSAVLLANGTDFNSNGSFRLTSPVLIPPRRVVRRRGPLDTGADVLRRSTDWPMPMRAWMSALAMPAMAGSTPSATNWMSAFIWWVIM